MEIEADEVVAHAAGHDVAAGIDMDEDGMAVVFKLDGAGDVVELDGLKRLVEARAANVDGRLLVALRAGLVSRVELVPDERASFALVVPWCCGLRGGQCGCAQCEGGKYRKTHRLLLECLDARRAKKHSRTCEGVKQ